MRIISLIGLLAFSSCATKPAAVYWTKHGDVASVHHVIGAIDKIERLSSEPSDIEGIPDDQKAFSVVESKVDVLPKEKPSPSPKKEKKDAGTSKLADEVHDLKSQVKSLKERVSAAIPQPTPAEQPAQQEAEASPTPRMSQ